MSRAATISARVCAPGAPLAPPSLAVVPYDAARDYERVAAWWAAHAAPVIAARWLPREGFMAWLAPGADGGTEPRAALWLYRLEGVPLALLDNLVTAPGLAPRAAAAAARAVIAAGVAAARSGGADAVISTTRSSGVAALCARSGWSALGCWALVRATGQADHSPRAARETMEAG